MRLINSTTFKLESFFDDNAIPEYAILSHTWGADEVSFQDIQDIDSAALKEGFAKIKFTCEEALERGLQWAWVDTCCIDKTSSAELSEAINSMFNWYKKARECYAFLADVPDWTDIRAYDSPFSRSRWFTRGWTLQELLAPVKLFFFSNKFHLIGTGRDMAKEVSRITGIGEAYLTGKSTTSSASIAQRMSWASSRVTTRKEDIAYCLLGLFDINMPLMYGEGEKSFRRLQEEIIKISDDQTIFVWGNPNKGIPGWLSQSSQSIFAKGPSSYSSSGQIVTDELTEFADHYYMTNKGLKISLPVKEHSLHGYVAILSCRHIDDLFHVVALPIVQYDSFFMRTSEFVIIPRSGLQDRNTTITELTLLNDPQNYIPNSSKSWFEHTAFLVRQLPESLAILRVEHGEYEVESRIIHRRSDIVQHTSIILHNPTHSFKALIEIYYRYSLKGTSILSFPFAETRVLDFRNTELVPFDPDDPFAISAILSPRSTRLHSGLEVTILDIQFISQTDKDWRKDAGC